MSVENLITEHLDIWTSAIKTKSATGRGSSKKLELVGVKKLRELILELAVRGKLVPQDPNDEPASELLKKIEVKKNRLMVESKLKKQKQKPLPPIAEEEKPFESPRGWEWVRLGAVTEIVRGITFPSSEKSRIPEIGRVACLRTTNVQDQIEWDDLLYIGDQYVKREDQYVLKNDIVMSMANSRELVGKVAIISEAPDLKTSFGGFLGVIRPINLNASFVMCLLRVPTNRELLIGSASQTTNIANISLAKLNPMVFSVPPLAEQNRIAAKVDELMALCDQLEAQTEASIDAHKTLVEVLLATLTDAKDADELNDNWQTISQHFDVLFTTQASIDQLKQTILQLAVMGRVVSFGDDVSNLALKDLLSFGPRNGFSPKEVSYGTELKVLKLGATSYGELDLKQSKFIDEIVLEDSHLWLSIGDILIQRGNSANFVGSNVLVSEECSGYIYPDLMMKIRANNLVEPSFLSLVLMSQSSREYMWNRMTGTSGTMPKISKRIVENIPITLPTDKKIQREIVIKVCDLISLCESLKSSIKESQNTQLHLADSLPKQVIN
jgi:type I restriction enzyme S subunit